MVCPFALPTLPTTTTTPPVSTTTTTTVPCVTPFAGKWAIPQGQWSVPDGCGVYGSRTQSPFEIAGCTGGQLFGFMDVPGGIVAASLGTWTSTAFSLDTGVFTGGDGCAYDVTIDASGVALRATHTPLYFGTAVLSIVQQCGLALCRTTLTGTAYEAAPLL